MSEEASEPVFSSPIRCRNRHSAVGVLSSGKSIYYKSCVLPGSVREMQDDMKAAFSADADAVELCTKQYENLKELADALTECDEVVNRMKPLILNLNETGSDQTHTQKERAELVCFCAGRKLADAVDIPYYDRELQELIGSDAAASELKTILSFREYGGLPSEEAIIEKMKEAGTKGADLVKGEYLANDDVDLIKGARASRKLKEEKGVSQPFCISLLGDVGLMYRVLAERCGNDFGYAVLRSGAEGMLLETIDETCGIREMFRRETV